MTPTPVKPGCDPRAKAVAEAVYAAVRPVAVILFGSRARGDYREDSDVDLLIITADDADNAPGGWQSRYVAASAAAHDAAESIYGHLMGVDVVDLPESKFADGRRAKNHVAGQAVRDGVIVSQQPCPAKTSPPPTGPTSARGSSPPPATSFP